MLLVKSIVLLVNVSVLDVVTTLTHSIDTLHAEARDIVVSEACHNSILPTPIVFDVLEAN